MHMLGSAKNHTILNVAKWIWHTFPFNPVQTPSCWTTANLRYGHRFENWSLKLVYRHLYKQLVIGIYAQSIISQSLGPQK